MSDKTTVKIPDLISEDDLDVSEPTDAGMQVLSLIAGIGILGVIIAFAGNVSDFLNSKIAEHTGIENEETNKIEVV